MQRQNYYFLGIILFASNLLLFGFGIFFSGKDYIVTNRDIYILLFNMSFLVTNAILYQKHKPHE
jgi:hypothetical protein